MNDQIEQLITDYDQAKITRRQLLSGLAMLTAASTAVPGLAADEETREPAFQGQSLNHVTLSVSDVERSRQFYSSILGVSVISKQKNGINLGLGDSFLGLYSIKEPPRVNHFCVGLDEFHVRVAAERLRQFGVVPRVRKGQARGLFPGP